jgi:hypothetical protein
MPEPDVSAARILQTVDRPVILPVARIWRVAATVQGSQGVDSGGSDAIEYPFCFERNPDVGTPQVIALIAVVALIVLLVVIRKRQQG